MVVAPDGHIVFRQALDSGSVEDSRVAVPDLTGVGQRIETQIGHNLRVNRNSCWNAARVSCVTKIAGSSLRRRHDVAESVALSLTDPFVIGENEGLVLYNGKSAGGSELV